MKTIEAHDLSGRYGRGQGPHDGAVIANAGEVTCIFGPNGCGKSTLLKVIAGAIGIWSGEISMDDQPLTGLPSHKVLQRGLALMPQGGGVFPRLTVLENLRIGAYTIRSRQDRDERIAQVLDDNPRLRDRIQIPAGSLSGGEQMMLAIGRALLLRPQFALFDEPSAGLSPLSL